MTTETNIPATDTVENEQKETYLHIPDGITPEYEAKPNQKMGEKVIKGIIIGRGNSQRVISIEEVKKLASLHLTYKDMAEFFGCKETTFRDNFRSVVEREKQKTKQKLMYAMLQNATEKMNPTIQIWLSKNLLGFTDQPINSNEDKVLPWLEE